eukprot:920506-Karenia_brevis.AAC.1
MSPKQRRLYVAGKRLARALEDQVGRRFFVNKETGVITLDWQEVAVLTAEVEKDPIKVQWKKKRAHSLGIDTEEAKSVINPKPRAAEDEELWSG